MFLVRVLKHSKGPLMQMQDWLSQLVQEAPHILKLIHRSDLKSLLATNRALRYQVHNAVSKLQLERQDRHSLRHDPVSYLRLLVKGKWQQLQHLTLQGINLHSRNVTLLTPSQWPLLTLLIMRDCQVSGKMARLANAPLHQLQDLQMVGTQLTADDLAQLSRGHLPNLTKLHIESQHCEQPVDSQTASHVDGTKAADMFTEIVNTSHWVNLTKLTAVGFGKHLLNMAWLVKGDWPSLKALHFGEDAILPGCCLLLSHSQWPSMETLDLMSTKLGETRALHPHNSFNWLTLKCLDLTDCSLGNDDIGQVATGVWPQLEKLFLHGNDFNEMGMQALATACWLRLTILDVSCFTVGSAAILMLMTGHWPNLECLEVCAASEANDDLDCIADVLCPWLNVQHKVDNEVNVIAEPEFVAFGRWPKISKLIFSDPAWPSVSKNGLWYLTADFN